MAVLHVKAVAGALIRHHAGDGARPVNLVQAGIVLPGGDEVADAVLGLHAAAAAQSGVGAHAPGAAAVIVLCQQLHLPALQVHGIEIHVFPVSVGGAGAGGHHSLLVIPEADHSRPHGILLQQASVLPALQIIQVDAVVLISDVRPGVGLVEHLSSPHPKGGAVRRLLRDGSQGAVRRLIEVQTGSQAVGKALAVEPEGNFIHHLVGIALGFRPLLQLCGSGKQVPALIHRVHALRGQVHGKLLLRLPPVQGNLVVAGLLIPAHSKKDCPVFRPGIMLHISPAGQSPGHLSLAVVDVQISLISIVL